MPGDAVFFLKKVQAFHCHIHKDIVYGLLGCRTVGLEGDGLAGILFFYFPENSLTAQPSICGF